MAKQYGLSSAAMYRHYADDLPARLVRSTGLREMLETDDLMGQLRETQSQAYRMISEGGALDASGKIVDRKMLVQGIRLAQMGIRLMGEIMGKLKPQGSPTINVQQNNTSTVVIYAMPDNGTRAGERERMVRAFVERFGDVIPPEKLALLTPGSLALPPGANGVEPNENGNGRARSA